MGCQTHQGRSSHAPFLGQVVTLTGTPAANSYLDLYSQIWFLDGGKALGRNITEFRSRYCYRSTATGFSRWELREGAKEKIEAAIAHLVLCMSAKDHLDMPELIRNPIWVELPPAIRKEYRRLEREMFLQLDSGKDLVASSAGAKYAMCRSVANGGCYERTLDGRREAHYVHSAKVDALVDLFEELNGKNLLVAYLYHHDKERIRSAFPGAPVDRWRSVRHRVGKTD